MPRRSEPSRTPSTTSTSTPPNRSSATSELRPGQAVAKRLGLPVRDLDLLEQALIHSSWMHEHPDAARGHNERLEFLGDAVVNLTISEALYARHPLDDEGALSARRAAIVSTSGLARLAGRIELGNYLLLGEGESQRSGRRRPSLLASSFEALTGALYLDLGYERVRRWLQQLAEPELALEAPVLSLKSPKSRLQEYTQRRSGERPDYRLVEASGPDHEKSFRIEVWVDGEMLGAGEGPSRRTAETFAAAQAIERIRAERAAERVERATRTGTGGHPRGRPDPAERAERQRRPA
jgi:ribonuclease III